jgi:hypothetical protein
MGIIRNGNFEIIFFLVFTFCIKTASLCPTAIYVTSFEAVEGPECHFFFIDVIITFSTFINNSIFNTYFATIWQILKVVLIFILTENIDRQSDAQTNCNEW